MTFSSSLASVGNVGPSEWNPVTNLEVILGGEKFNRYLDLEFFKHFLYQNVAQRQHYYLM